MTLTPTPWAGVKTETKNALCTARSSRPLRGAGRADLPIDTLERLSCDGCIVPIVDDAELARNLSADVREARAVYRVV